MSTSEKPDVDVVVVGAGFSGLYLLHRLRGMGLSVRVIDAAGDVGGTWYWNRYPGARCDIPTTDYTFGFDAGLEASWTWSEKYATQPEILRYLGHVADHLDLRRDITLSTRVTAAAWDDDTRLWRVALEGGETVSCRWYVMATGCLSVPKEVDIDGAGTFAGPTYSTGRWPQDGVDFTGRRVAVIGTGSSGIQAIPLIAAEAAELTVLQRTANFSVPAHHGPPPADRLARIAADRDAYRAAARLDQGGVPVPVAEISGVEADDATRRARFEQAWEEGELFSILRVFSDQGVSPESNAVVADMIRERIRAIVDDPATAEALCPTDHYFGTKRPCLDDGYYATYNQPHVRLVDLRATPISAIDATGIALADGTHVEVDDIVYATGFDAMTGALVGVDITGRDATTLRQRWAGGPETYLGLMTTGMPNLFMLTGPGSPSVLSNMAVSIEQHVEWVADCIAHLRAGGWDTIEPTPVAEAGWGRHAAAFAALTLHPSADSWYMGANVPGKPRMLLPYIGGVGRYRQICDEVAAGGYLGFSLRGPAGEATRDGVVREIQPDVELVLAALDEMGLPPLESLPAPDARALMEAAGAMAPPGPEVGEVVDGTLPGGDGGALGWRLWRPATPGPHPLVVWWHGGGWVLGGTTSDEPLCRDLCVRTDAAVLSVDYRHAPEAPFPAAAEDALAALRWAASHATELGAVPGRLAVAGWSAGGGLAAVAAQHAPGEAIHLAAQLLLTPVTDGTTERPSMADNAEGYVLTRPLMRWFWDQYAPDPAQRADPLASPLLGHLGGVAPAVVVTAQYDPLRDEGTAYAEALATAGVPVTLVAAAGHTHTSLTMVDVVVSGAAVRAEAAEALRHLLAPVGVGV